MAELGRVYTSTAATSEPVTLTEVKAHLRISHASEDTYLERLIKVAVQFVERASGLRLMPQTVDVVFDAPAGELELPVGPVQSVSSITVYKTDDSTESVSGSKLDTVSTPARLFVDAWPGGLRTFNAVAVRLAVGATSADAVNPLLKHAVLLLVGELYERREEASIEKLEHVPLASKRLLALIRRESGLA